MMQVTLKGMAGRKLRAALTALAIMLGVAMVSGTYAFTDRIDKAVDTLFTGAFTGADAVVSGKDVVESSASGDATVPADLLGQVAALPEVAAASGGIIDIAMLLDRQGKPISNRDAALGLSVDGSPNARRFNPLRPTAGGWPAGPQEAAIDAGTAEKHGFQVGDSIGISTRGSVHQFRIAGIAEFAGLDSIGELTFAVFDVPTAQALFGKAARLDEIWVAAKDGVSPEALVRKLQPLVPEAAEVATGRAQVRAESRGADEEVAKIQKFLLAFGGITLFVGAFVIFNTLSITITQRLRELATLRTLGASRRQVLASVVVESIGIGIVGSVGGLGLGLGLDRGLAALASASGDDLLPDSGAVLAARTVVVSLLAGVSTTVVAGLLPALRATSVPPLAAVREGATLPRRTRGWASRSATGAIALGVGVLSVGLFTRGLDVTTVFALLTVGCLVLFVGVAMISSTLVRPLASVLGRPAQRLAGTPGRLARDNSMRNPNRTAVTAGALMIYLALVTFAAVLGQGMRTSVTEGVDRVVRADYVVTADDGDSPVSPLVGEALVGARAAGTVSSVRRDTASAFGSDHPVDGLDPATIAEVVRLDWESGSAATLAALAANGAVLQRDFATDHDLLVGSVFRARTPQGRDLDLIVKGVYTPPGLDSVLAPIGISRETFDASFERPQDAFTFVKTSGGVSHATRRELEARLVAFPEAVVQTTSEFGDARAKEIRTTLRAVYVLLGMTVVVSLLGMVNTLALSVLERTRELGLLRAVGMTRRQVRRMIRHESVITALIGGTLGLPLGLLLAALVTHALAETLGVEFAVPGPALALLVVTSMLAGVAAAVFPARHASRLNVLEGLQYE